MLVLGLDTVLKSCSVAILKAGERGGDNFVPLEKGHAEHLAPMVARTLRDAGVLARDLDRVGVVIGPGGFAGVRVGLAFARGLAIGTKTKVVGVTSLEALAAALPADAAPLRAAIIDARRGQVYAALFEGATTTLTPFVAGPEEAIERLAVAAKGAAVAATGDGVILYRSLPSGWRADLAAAHIDAVVVARLAAAAPAPEAPPAPLYLRPPDASPSSASPFEGLLEPERLR